jgi:hypothetical protein
MTNASSIAITALLGITISSGPVRASDTPGLNVPPKPEIHITSSDADKGNCHFNYDKNGTQVKVCDKTVEIGGDIKDVDWEHPVGKGKAFIPQAGRDIEDFAHQRGRDIENAGQWLGDRLGIHW